MNPTGAEQEMLELLNNMRTDPQGHFARLVSSTSPLTSPDADVQSALNFFHVNGATLRSQWNGLTAAQPLAWSDALNTSAGSHNAAMIAADTQSHQLPGEKDIGGRATDAGYAGWTNIAENIYAYSDSPFFGHAGFAIDWGGSAATGGIQSPAGHRNNIMSNTYREVGITVTNETNAATDVGPQVITQDFGTRSALSGGGYLLGVVSNDLNANTFYNAGEGLGGVTVQVSGGGGFNRTLTSMTAGGYQTFLPAGAYTVTFSGGGLAAAVTRAVDVGTANVKLDVISGVTSPGGGGGELNHAPILNTAPAQTLRPVATNSVSPSGTAVSTLLNGVVTDADAGDSVGIAVTSLGGTAGGAWQYLPAGGSWQNIGALTPDAARLLGPNDQVRFVPFGNFVGTATISYKAWDGSTTSTNATTGGGAAAFSSATESATVRVQTAPTLAPALVGALPAISEDSTSPRGATITTLLGHAFSDPNSSTLTGVAITALSNTANGVWQYRYATATTWATIGAVSPASAFLLRGADYIRFVPVANFNGPLSLTVRAWDRSQGTLAGRWNVADPATVGGGTAFSAQTATVAGSVLAKNDAPVLDATASPTFAPAAGTAGAVRQTTVAALLGLAVTDVDAGAVNGIAVLGVTKNAAFIWEYSTDGGATWSSLNTSTSTAARLLRGTDMIRVRTLTAVASPLTARVVFRAWDQTQGAAGGTWDISAATALGGRSAFSVAADAAPVIVG